MIATVIGGPYPAFTYVRLGSQIVRTSRRNLSWPLALIAGCSLLLSGCARFDNTAAGQTFTPAPQLTPQAGPVPQLPEIGSPGPSSAPSQGPPTPIPPPQGCKDFDKAVIATCLDT